MNPNDLERALREDRPIEPSTDFAGRVMRAVRSDAADRRGIEFPWRRLLPGLGICALLTLAGLVATALGRGLPPVDPTVLVGSLERSTLAASLAWATTALVGSFAIAWGSLRVVGQAS